MAEIVVGGDICPINRNLPFFLTGDAAALFGDLLPEFERADLTIVNLECPLIDTETPIKKSGPVLGADLRAVAGLLNAHIGVVNLANNHLLDHGTLGLESTIATCENAGLSIVGAGKNLQKAGQMLIRNIDGIRLGILAYAEREFSIAGNDSPGASPLSLARFVRSIRRHKDDYDYLVILLHGGTEHYPFPSPGLQDTCRFMVEEGAGAVICQHSHCPGCYETYENGHIVYGQGNLLFDRYPDRGEDFYKGYLVRLSITGNRTANLGLVPYRQSDAQAGARKMEPNEACHFTQKLEERSKRIQDPDFVTEQWAEHCRKKKSACFSTLRGHERWLRYLNRKASFANYLYSTQGLLNLQNLLRCESHRETLETLLDGILHEQERR